MRSAMSGRLRASGANTGVDLAFSLRTSSESLVNFDIEGRSITTGSAPGSATRGRVANAVATPWLGF
jgi:hypothetical protein